MSELLSTLAMALGSGLGIPVGALVSSRERLRSRLLQLEIDSFVSYFGGGALTAAVALVLVPHGMEESSIPWAAGAFLVGSLGFWRLDVWVKRRGGSASQLVGLLLDFIPESIALGAATAAGSNVGVLLAGLILLQNLPEGFAAFSEMRRAGTSRARIWTIFLVAPLAGPLAAWLGYALFAGRDGLLALLMLFCSGGILYLVFDDIAPGAHLRSRDFPALGAVLGFLLGMVGTMAIH